MHLGLSQHQAASKQATHKAQAVHVSQPGIAIKCVEATVRGTAMHDIQMPCALSNAS